ncbi:MAG: hemerythrin domain-containing protein [Bacteroidota bacterium]
MKRYQSLAPLSREHHPALLLAQLLKKNAPLYKGMPAEPVAKAVYALNFFLTDLKTHFEKEELLLKKVAGFNKEIDRVAVEIIQEHGDLTNDFLTIQTTKDPADRLDALGRQLEQHIRKEERVLFPLIEQYCPEALLTEIAVLIT